MTIRIEFLFPTNWPELSREAQEEFKRLYTPEYFRLYEVRIGPIPGRGRGPLVSEDDQQPADATLPNPPSSPFETRS